MRIISDTFRNQIESVRGDDVVVAFATIYHESWSAYVRVNSDIYDYWYNGFLYYGTAFSLSLVSDNDRVPQATVTFQNVDRRIGKALRRLGPPPRLNLQLLLKSDFDDGDPRRPIAPNPTVEYEAKFLFLQNVTVSAQTVSADIRGYDLTTEPWPAIRTTPTDAPAIYR